MPGNCTPWVVRCWSAIRGSAFWPGWPSPRAAPIALLSGRRSRRRRRCRLRFLLCLPVPRLPSNRGHPTWRSIGQPARSRLPWPWRGRACRFSGYTTWPPSGRRWWRLPPLEGLPDFQASFRGFVTGVDREVGGRVTEGPLRPFPAQPAFGPAFTPRYYTQVDGQTCEGRLRPFPPQAVQARRLTPGTSNVPPISFFSCPPPRAAGTEKNGENDKIMVLRTRAESTGLTPPSAGSPINRAQSCDDYSERDAG